MPVLLAACVVALLPAGAHSEGLTLDAVLKMEGFGEARFDPSGRWLAYERIRPYDAYPDYSYRTYAFRKSGHRVWRVDLQAGSAPEPVPGLDPDAHAWIESFSPGGTRLAVMQYKSGRLSLSACDMEAGTCTTFSPVPRIDWTGAYRPVWISEDELVFTALPEGRQAPEASLRYATGAWLTRAWAAAWRGDTVTSDEVRTRPPDLSGQAAPGCLVRADAVTGETEVLAEGRFADLRLMPGGEKLAALSVSGQRSPDPGRTEEGDRRGYGLVLFDLVAGTQKRAAEALDIVPYTLGWSPDGTRLLFFAREDGQGLSEGRFRVLNTRTGGVTTYTHNGLDLASERERGFVQRPERAVFLGEDVAVFARENGPGNADEALFTPRDIGERGLTRADWYLLSASGTHKLLTGSLDDVSGVLVGIGDSCLLVQARQGLFCLRSDGDRQKAGPGAPGALRLIPAGSYSTFGALSRPDPGGSALLMGGTGRDPAALLVGPARHGLPKTRFIEAPGSGTRPVAGSFVAGAVLFREESGASSGLLLVQAGKAGRVRWLARINSHLEDVSFGTWQGVSYPLAKPDGTSEPELVTSCLLLPPNPQQEPLPLIVEVYPGIRPACEPSVPVLAFPNPNSPYLWAGRGYAYARIALPREFIGNEEGPIAGMDEAVEAGLDAILATGQIDADKIVLSGFSQGAVSALYVAAHSDRFAAVIARNGWADLTSHYFGPPGIYSILDPDYFGSEFIRYEAEAGSEFGIGRTPFEDPDIYTRNSPVLLAPDISAPVLLMHSDMDSFSMSQFDEMYSALLRAGKDARYVRYWGEGHGPSSPANIRDMWNRLDLFLDELGLTPEMDGEKELPER